MDGYAAIKLLDMFVTVRYVVTDHCLAFLDGET